MSRMVLVYLILFLLFLVSCLPAEVPAEKQCTSAADCVPAQCCHATNAVNQAYAPDCREIFCTLECAPNSLDCGQGEIRCQNKVCTVVLK